MRFPKFIAWWLLLNFISLPISYRYLPSVGQWISSLLFPLNKVLCWSLFHIDISDSYLLSDSAAFFTTSLIIIPVILVFSFGIISGLKRVFQTPILYTNLISSVHIALRFILVYFLLRYGFDKIIGQQFYFPASNTLHTPVGYLSKDLLYWSTMGTSSFYNWFMAIIEITCGIMILIPRFRFAGLLFSVGVLINILATNIGFDITVKFLSGLLLLTSIYLLSFYTSQLRLLFGMKNVNTSEQATSIEKRSKLKISLTVIVLLIIGLEVLVPNGFVKTDYPFKSASYTIKSNDLNSDLQDTFNLKRIHIHREGYLITETKNQEFRSYTIQATSTGFILNGKKFTFNNSHSLIKWNENEELKTIKIKEIDLSQLQLSEDKTHLFLEELIIQ